MLFACEIVQVGFALDCHEVLAHVAAAEGSLRRRYPGASAGGYRTVFGAGERPDAPIQWLSDNGMRYTALDTIITAERLHLVPITTPVLLSRTVCRKRSLTRSP